MDNSSPIVTCTDFDTSRSEDAGEKFGVAAMASIYAEPGYFDQKMLHGSWSHHSLLNGHPGPVLPGVHIAIGPMGQGIGVAEGFAIAGRTSPRFDSYAMVGDGELQEGSCWEAVMYAGQNHLDNFCVLVDRNNGQLDVHNRTLFPMPNLNEVFQSYGWQTFDVDATQYDGVVAALEQFRFSTRNARPTAIICNTTKGYGAFSDFMNKHKVTITEALIVQEMELQRERRAERVAEFLKHLEDAERSVEGREAGDLLLDAARGMHLDVDGMFKGTLPAIVGPVLTKRVPARDKEIKYEAALLPKFDNARQFSAAEVLTGAMKVFARDSRVVSIDSDLASTSGLEAGIAAVDQRRALNVGVAEANMMLIGEAFAALGSNVWTSTFCQFFNWQVLRRIAVGQQKRVEAMESRDGWLSEGHGLDITFLATAANFETRTNGATHMGNDDNTTFDAVGQLRIIDVCCPQQMLSIMKWIMDGNKGLLYVRLMRTGSAVLYDEDYVFEFGNAQILRQSDDDSVAVISSGRGVHEALAAAELCAISGVGVTVVDFPSVDEVLLLELYNSGKELLFAEQNNGYLWQNFLKVVYRNRDVATGSLQRVRTVNTLNVEGRPQFIHSATYEELIEAFRLTPARIAKVVEEAVRSSNR